VLYLATTKSILGAVQQEAVGEGMGRSLLLVPGSVSFTGTDESCEDEIQK